MKQESFLWGAATSAHQVEGNNIHNDWWAWEKKHHGVRSGRAANHYELYAQDFYLAASLGHNAHRLSLEWSRIEPAPGQWNERAITHYRDVLLALRRAGLTSFVTLHHFTNPQWLAERGGWEASGAPARFASYVRYVTGHLGDLVDFWITINEPMVLATQSYWAGRWPPQKKSAWSVLRVVRHLARAHELAYRDIHRAAPGARVGIAKHLVAYLPEHKEQFDDRLYVAAADWWFNHRFFSLTGKTHDFIGVNYYFTVKKKVHLFPPSVADVAPTGATTDIGWPIRPDGLEHVLLQMRRYQKPLYITENGLADASDRRRPDFIRDHLRAVERAQAQGADVRGYLHWSLLDNLEWDLGFGPRFGLVEVDFASQKRTPRPSAYVYKAIIEQARRLEG